MISKHAFTHIWCSSIVVEQLKTTFEDKNAAIAYFYFERVNQDQHSKATVLGSLLQQVALRTAAEDLPAELFEIYRSSRRGAPQDEDKLLSVLLSFASKITSMFVILDALDECKETELDGIMSILEQLEKASFRIFATSRPHLRNLSTFSDVPTIQIVAHIDDVKNYLAKRVSQKIAPQRALNKTVVDSIAHSSQGV
jgi:hypothetical protein